MKWFAGSIDEAVTTSKERKAIFVVFIEGKDETSGLVAAVINEPEVSERLERDDFVAIKLESDGKSYRFFQQCYQVATVPSLFFIGTNGLTLEIVAGSVTAADLTKKIDSLLEKVGESPAGSSSNLVEAKKNVPASANVPQATSAFDKTESAASPVADLTKITDSTLEKVGKSSAGSSSSLIEAEKNVSASANVPQASSALDETNSAAPTAEADTSAQAPKEISTEEKLARAKQLMELQRRQKIEKEREEEKKREIERRRLGKDVQALKQKQHEAEIKLAHEERMREKAAEAAAKERVRQQIAQDKLDRKHRELALQEQVAQQQKQNQQDRVVPTAGPSVEEGATARIQFRLPSGSPHTGKFEATSTLGSLRSYVVSNIELPFQKFALSTTFPRRDLTAEDDDKTLTELELVPTAVILILPVKNSKVTTAVTTTEDVGFVSRFIWALFAPIFSVYNYVVGYFTGEPASRPEERPGQANVATSGAQGNAERFGRSAGPPSGLINRNLFGGPATTIRSRGNIHRLHTGADDNDENNTWNGNSTQQM